VFTNVRPLWHPPGARGIYGGGAIAQSLCAAQLTVSKGFIVHSMHFYFLNAGDAESPIFYHVERIRDGRSFASRTVQARQRDRPIFTTTISFIKSGVSRKLNLEHSPPKPDVPLPQQEWKWGDARPFECHKAGILNRMFFSLTLLLPVKDRELDCYRKINKLLK
jgi:acyl-CoA thioesterase II